MAWGAYIPALADKSAAADGSEIRHLGGLFYNGAECSTIETDADYTIFEGANLMGNGVDTWNAISGADYSAHINGTAGVWLQWRKINDICHINERVAYPVGLALTEAEYDKTVSWAQKYTSSCGGGVIPFI